VHKTAWQVEHFRRLQCLSLHNARTMQLRRCLQIWVTFSIFKYPSSRLLRLTSRLIVEIDKPVCFAIQAKGIPAFKNFSIVQRFSKSRWL